MAVSLEVITWGQESKLESDGTDQIYVTDLSPITPNFFLGPSFPISEFPGRFAHSPAAVFDTLDMVSTPSRRRGSGRLQKKYRSDGEGDFDIPRRGRGSDRKPGSRRLLKELSDTESEDDVEPPHVRAPPSLRTPETDRSKRYRERHGSVAEGMDEPIEGTQLYIVPKTPRPPPRRRRELVPEQSVIGSNAVLVTSSRDDPESDADEEGSDESSERDDNKVNDALVAFDSPVARVAQVALVEDHTEETVDALFKEWKDRKRERDVREASVEEEVEARPVPRSPIYLDTVFAEKDFVKNHDASWDGDQRKWFWGYFDRDLNPCGRREPVPDALKRFVHPRKRVYLYNRFEEKDFVKYHGGMFDPVRKRWWVYEPVPLALQQFQA